MCYKNTLRLTFFTSINLILSIIAIFISSSRTDRYNQVLKYLELLNNGNLDFVNCEKLGYIDDDYYCDIDGKKLRKPSDKIRYQNIFKKWNKLELILNISRAAVIVPILVFSFFVFKKDKKALFNLLLIFLFFLILVTVACITIRSLVSITNDDIGLYEDGEGEKNSFFNNMVANFVIDIFEILFYLAEICQTYLIISGNSYVSYTSDNRAPSPKPGNGGIIVGGVVVGVINSDGHPLDNFN